MHPSLALNIWCRRNPRRRCLPMFTKMRPNSFMNHGYPGQIRAGRPAYYPINHQSIPRNQPYSYQGPIQSHDWMPYPQQVPYFQQSAYHSNVPNGIINQQMPYPSGQNTNKDAQFLFQNPLQPQEVHSHNPYMGQVNGYPLMNPYPINNGFLKQPGGIQSIMNSFKSQDGTVDVNKMVNTAGQMVNAVSQVSSLVKGLGGIFKV